MSHWLPRRVQAGVAVGLAVGIAILSNSAAVADQVRNEEWWLQSLHVTQAWESTHGAGVTVAVLDTGVSASQPDLSGSVTTGPDFTHSGRTAGGSFWGIHGTEVASIIAGHGHGTGNADGIIGIAPAAKVLSVRVTLEQNDPLMHDATTAAGLPNAIARGITYAVKHGADVIDLPLDPATTPGAAGSGGNVAERRAITRAIAHHVVLVAPAGDNGAGTDAPNYPAAYRGVISVGAFDAHFVKAPFTSRQSYVTLTAAGQSMIAAKPAGNYKAINSTSAASAVVAGIAALVKSLFPDMAPAKVTKALTLGTAFHPKTGRRGGSGFGTADAAKTLMAAAKLAEAVPKADDSAAGSPPSPPAVHATVTSRHLGRTLAIDAGIAVVVFLILLGLILVVRAGQRRRARGARLAEVRAAARVQPRAEPAAAAGAQAGFMTAPAASVAPVTSAAPSIPGMPAAGSVSGAGSLPGAVASRLGGARAETSRPGAGRARRNQSVEHPADPPGSIRPPTGPAHAPAAGGTPALPFRQPPARPASGPAAAEADAPHGLTASGLPRRVQPPPAAFPESAFPAGSFPGAGAAADAGTGTFGGSLFGGGPFREGASPPPSAPPPPPPADTGAGPHAGHSSFGSPPRSATVRRPSVSGTPPWEPAEPPGSELPWNQAPAPRADAAPLPQARAPYSESSWDAIAEEVWPGGPRAADPHPPAPPTPEPDAPATAGWPSARGASGSWDASPAAEQAQRDRPIYVWNPTARGTDKAAAPTRNSPPWEGGDPEGAAQTADRRNAPPWEDLDGVPSDLPGDDDGGSFPGGPAVASPGLAASGLAGRSAADGMFTPGPSGDDDYAALAGTGYAAPAADPFPGVSQGQAPADEPGDYGSGFLPAAPAGNGTFSPPGGTANSYLWTKTERSPNSFPTDQSGLPAGGAGTQDTGLSDSGLGDLGGGYESGGLGTGGSGSFDPGGDSTETFSAVQQEPSTGRWRLSLPTESTETFPAVPRGDNEGTQDDG